MSVYEKFKYQSQNLLVFTNNIYDINFCWGILLFLTKRIDRFMKCIPDDWKNGYDNVVICCTIENQKKCRL